MVGGGSASTLMARDYKSARDLIVENDKIVRRLTPTECLALQGMPKTWFDGVKGSDSAKYRATGNAIALPCAFDVLKGITEYDNRVD